MTPFIYITAQEREAIIALAQANAWEYSVNVPNNTDEIGAILIEAKNINDCYQLIDPQVTLY